MSNPLPVVPKGKNSIVITYFPGANLAWLDPVKSHHPNINFIFVEINAQTRNYLNTHGFISVPGAQFYPNGRQSLCLEGKIDATILEQEIKSFRF